MGLLFKVTFLLLCTQVTSGPIRKDCEKSLSCSKCIERGCFFATMFGGDKMCVAERPKERVKSIFGKTTKYCSAAEVREDVEKGNDTKLETQEVDSQDLISGKETQEGKVGEWTCLGRQETVEERMTRAGCRWNKLNARLAAKKLYEFAPIILANNTQCEALFWRRKMC